MLSELESSESDTLSPLPLVLYRGLTVVAVFAILSFVSTFSLLIILAHRIFFKSRKGVQGVHQQFIFLIFNLLLADIQQAIAYTMNLNWVAHNEVRVGSAACYAQGWFVTMGNLSSGVWTLAIGIHTFGCIALSYSPSPSSFYKICAVLWMFCLVPSLIGLGQHPKDFFSRAETWCWINSKYTDIRLWGHYFWIFLSEFGSALIYASLFIILRMRVRKNYFNPVVASRAQKSAKMMLIYPAVYVVCTLPLASARMASLTGTNPSLTHMCIAGSMITSTGWLDVLVYSFTRKVLQDAESAAGEGLNIDTEMMDTFHYWDGNSRFGTTTVIEAGPHLKARPNRATHNSSTGATDTSSLSRQDSTELLFRDIGPGLTVKTETTVVVHSEPLELNDIAGVTYANSKMHAVEKDRVSFDTEESTSKRS